MGKIYEVVYKRLEDCDKDIGPGIVEEMCHLFDGSTVRTIEVINDYYTDFYNGWHVHSSWIKEFVDGYDIEIDEISNLLEKDL